MQPHVQRVFLNSSPELKTFEANLLSMDAIVVGGGSTLNMLAIWHAQGIDTVLKEAYNKGIVLAGGSAGSLCWFTSGYTDSRPQKLSIMHCLDFIHASHCPHYHSEASRRPLYHEAILKGLLPAGFACDDAAGMLFQNEQFIKAVSLNTDNHCYFVSAEHGMIDEKLLPAEILK
jgi:peptidase E